MVKWYTSYADFSRLFSCPVRDMRHRYSSNVKFVFEIIYFVTTFRCFFLSSANSVQNQNVWTSELKIQVTWVGLGRLFPTLHLAYLLTCKCCLCFLPDNDWFCQTFALRMMVKMPLSHHWGLTTQIKAKAWFSRCYLNAQNISLQAHYLFSLLKRFLVTFSSRPVVCLSIPLEILGL